MPENRRRFARVRASLRFTLAWGERFELFRTIDLSAAGALLVRHVPDSPMPLVDAEAECAFNIDSTEIRVNVLVVRSSRGHCAVKFVGLERRLEDRIASWVFRMEAQRLARRF
jgi:c-di-GMP-binding flagellar brake protein YcgR